MNSQISIGQSAQALYQNLERKAQQGYTVESGALVSINSGTLGSSDTLSVGSGTIYFGGTVTSVGTQNVQIDGSDPDDPRKDVVYLDGTGTAQVAKGTPKDPPQVQKDRGDERFEFIQPEPDDLASTESVVLAEVWVPAGASGITSADLADRRVSTSVVPTLESNVDAKGNDISNVGALSTEEAVVGREVPRNLVSEVESGEDFIGINVPGDFDTIQEAVNQIPYFVNHRVRISIDPGTYDEDVEVGPAITRFFPYQHDHRSNPIIIEGNGTDPSDVKVGSFVVTGMGGNNAVRIKDMELTRGSAKDGHNASVGFFGCRDAAVASVNITNSEERNGHSPRAVLAYASNVDVAGDIDIGTGTHIAFDCKHGGYLYARESVGDIVGSADYLYRAQTGIIQTSGVSATHTINLSPSTSRMPIWNYGDGMVQLPYPIADGSREWVNVATSRSLGTWETAPEYDIEVSVVIGAVDSDLGRPRALLDVNTSQTGNIVGRVEFDGVGDNDVRTLSATVPAGHNYRVSDSSIDDSSVEVVHWRELRK